MTLEQLKEAAAQHAERLEADIPLARTRDEHIRVTARANEALALLNGLNVFAGKPLYEFESATFVGGTDMDGTVNN